MPAKAKIKAAPKAIAPKASDAMADIKIKPLSTEVLEKLNNFLKKTGLEEIEISQGDASVRLKRPGSGVASVPAPIHQQMVEITKEIAPKNTFNAPMIGTFYRSASPESAPFAKVGDTVRAGQVLCIIEAMKTMNQIETDRAGKITKILVENATPVEFGQPLFVIE